MISLQQIKAARALLDWTQRDLANVSGVSLAAIAQIERGAGNPRNETMRTLEQAFAKHDIEFTDDPGVKIRHEPFHVTIWQGREAMLKCWQDIESTLSKGGDLRISCVDDGLWKEMYPKEMLEMYRSRSRLGIRTLGLLTDPTKNHSNWTAKNYRLVPPEATSPRAPYYVYETKVAIIKMRDPIRIVVVDNPTIAESFLAQFQYHWDRGKSYADK